MGLAFGAGLHSFCYNPHLYIYLYDFFTLGKSNAKGLALSTFFGAISSSCSYAAASMARTLIVKGASWGNAIAFMIASTNLVFEIFLVIVTLLGWSFFGGEILGGLLFILIGALFVRLFITKASIQRAKEYMQQTETKIQKNDPQVQPAQININEPSHDQQQEDKTNYENQKEPDSENKTPGKLNRNVIENWKTAAGYFYMDVTMVGRYILIGVIIASVLSAAVLQHFWNTLFLQNDAHFPQFVIILWNAIIGIFIALFAFVCSVGNILLATVLWHGGISFGGVIAFILADLITIPMLMVYRNYYGVKMMWRLFLILTFAILQTAIGTDYIFQWAGWMPQSHGMQIGMRKEGIQWNYKTVLNLIFIPLSVIGFL
jgi:hypothetical protein